MRPLAFVVFAACHSTPVSRPEVDQACAPALPALAQQHTRNVTTLYLAPFELAGTAVKVGTLELATTKHGYVNQASFTGDGAGMYFTWRPEDSQADIYFHDFRTGAEHAVTCSSEEEYGATPTRDGLIAIRVAPDLARTLVRLDASGHVRDTLFPTVHDLGAYVLIDDDTAVLFFGDATGTRIMLGHLHTGAVEPIADNVTAAVAVIPGTHAISYVDQSDDTHAELVRFELDTHVKTPLMPVPDGIEKYAWLADGSVIYGDGTKLVRSSPAQPEPHEVIDLRGAITGTVTRVTVGAGRIAIVTH